MKTAPRILAIAAISILFTGCAAMKEGMANLNQMAQTQAVEANKRQLTAWKADIKKGTYSGKVRVMMLPVVPPKKGKTGLIPEKAIASLKKHFGSHPQFDLLDDKKTDSLKRDLHPFAGSLSASRVNKGVARRQRMGGVDADVVLRNGMKLDSFTGINKKTGKIGQGIKVICWTEYMVIGDGKVTKGKAETTNIFKNEEAVVNAAVEFHKTVLNKLMIENLKRRVAKAEAASSK